MKKIKNQGFMLAETLIVSTVVMSVLIIIYVQFRNINKNYGTTFNYNTVNALYNVKNISNYILTENFSQFLTVKGDAIYLDITDCNSGYYNEKYYCEALYETLNVKKILLTDEDTTKLRTEVNTIDDFSEELKSFINYISPSKILNKYRLIVEFNDNTFATLQI